MSDLPPPLSTEPTPSRGTPLAEPLSSIPPSLTQPPPPKLTQNPQIMAALITGMISLMVAIVGIVPALVEAAKDDSTPTPPPLAAVIATFTPVNTQIVLAAPTDTPVVSQPNIVAVGGTMTSLPVIGSSPVPADPQPTADSGASTSNNAAAQEPNVRLYFDNASFTIRNQGGNRKMLADVSFYSDDARWNASQWGLIHEDFKKQKCLRLRDASLGPRNPPSECQGNNLLSLMEVGTPVIFWRADDGFRVERNGVEIGVCTVSPCDLYLPPK